MDKKPPRRPGRPTSIDGFIPSNRLSPRPLNRAAFGRSAEPTSKKPTSLHVQQPHLGGTTTPLSPLTTLPSTGPRRPNIKNTARRHKKHHWRRIGLSAGALLVLVGSFYGWRLLANLNKAFHGNIFSDAKALVSTHKLKGEDQGRVNILLAGNSADDPGHAGAQLTDSIMVLSIDTKKHTAFMLSIPRDTWVAIPTLGHQKINAANTVTSFHQSGYPDGGMGQLEQIISQDMGIPVQYYALINYNALKEAVDAVNGITVTINSPDPRGLYDSNIERSDGGPLKLPNGPVNLNGQQALNLARARGDGYTTYGFPRSDFDRTEHQRQMMVALGQKASTAGVLANPIKMNQLFSAIGKNVQSDMGFADVLRLSQLGKTISINNVQSLSIGNDGDKQLLVSYTAPNGQSALAPAAGLDSFGAIQQYYQRLTSDNPVVKESPSVVVLNGGKIDGLAYREEQALQDKGYNVVGIASAGQTYGSSMIIDQTKGKKPNSLKYLQSIAPKGTVVASSGQSGEAYEAQGYTSDFVIVMGQNWPNIQ